MRGYDEREVDDFLDEVVAELRRIVKDSDDLREQLNECRQSKGMSPVAKQDVAKQFLAYLRSWSATQRYMKANGSDPVATIERELVAAWGDPAAPREVRWDFHVRCGRRKQ